MQQVVLVLLPGLECKWRPPIAGAPWHRGTCTAVTTLLAESARAPVGVPCLQASLQHASLHVHRPAELRIRRWCPLAE
jgi:hypothetical protein